jgi:hypothetical protein
VTQPVTVGPLLPDMLDTATATVARAFVNDAMMAWVLPSADTRLQQMSRLNRVPLQYAWRHRMPVRQTDAGAGVAIWMPPGSR